MVSGYVRIIARFKVKFVVRIWLRLEFMKGLTIRVRVYFSLIVKVWRG